MKRFLDIICAAFGLILLLPLLCPLAILLRMTGEGKVFYRQERMGFGLKPFFILKFATMLDNSPSLGSGDITLKNDPRVLPVGRVLRKTKINELPQLWNVLVGEMSLIGPRPEQVDLIDLIEEEIPMFSLRHSIRPGITGWAQVHQGYVNDIRNLPTKLSYDLWYINNVSGLVDISIAIRTLKILIAGFRQR